MTNYKIEFSDKGKVPIDVPYKSFSATTPIILHGSKSVEYGLDLNSNLYHLLENFCNDYPPVNAIQGQLWYDTNERLLKIYDGYFWVVLGYTKPPTVPGDAISNSILDITLSGYLPTTGGMLTGPLLLKDTEESDDDNSLVTKKYVDRFKTPVPDDLIPLAGNVDVTTGLINIVDYDITNINQAVSKQYVDDNVAQLIQFKENEVQDLTNVTVGYANIVILKPSMLTYIFGQGTLDAGKAYHDISFAAVGPFIAASINVTALGAPDSTVQVSAKIINDAQNIKNTIRFIKHGTLTKAISFYYTFTGYKSS